jgi:hypothetical protein
MKGIPREFNKYFWDTDPDNLDIGNNKAYIIERLLELGDIEQLAWLNKAYSKEEIVKTIQKSRRISRKTGNFFSLYYGIPKGSLLCMKKHSI